MRTHTLTNIHMTEILQWKSRRVLALIIEKVKSTWSMTVELYLSIFISRRNSDPKMIAIIRNQERAGDFVLHALVKYMWKNRALWHAEPKCGVEGGSPRGFVTAEKQKKKGRRTLPQLLYSIAALESSVLSEGYKTSPASYFIVCRVSDSWPI